MSHPFLADTLYQIGVMADRQREWTRAEESYLKALGIQEESGDRCAQADTYHSLGVMFSSRQLWQQAEEHYVKALQIRKEFGDAASLAISYHELGRVAIERKQWKSAKEWYVSALEIFVKLSDLSRQADVHHQLGRLEEELQEFEQAQNYYERALLYYEETGRDERAVVYHGLGAVAQKLKKWQRAEDNYGWALQVHCQLGDEYGQAGVRVSLGSLAREQQQWEPAEKHYREALALYCKLGEKRDEAIIHDRLAELLMLCGASGDAGVPDLDVESGDVDGRQEWMERLAAGSLSTPEADSDVGRRLAELLSAILVLTDGRKEEEEEEMKKEAPEERARVLSGSGRLDEAVAAMDEAIAGQPEGPVRYFQRAALHCARSDLVHGGADYLAFAARGGWSFAPAIRECLAAGRCTFTATRREFVEQFWYECKTCGLVDDQGCCEACAGRCHRGHDLKVFPRMSGFYCVCGMRGGRMCCALENEK